MGYCFLHFDKVKTPQVLNKKFLHNYRQEETLNANPELFHKNKEYIAQNKESWIEIFNRRVNEGRLNGTMKKKLRKDAVMALEFVTTFSRGEKDNIDIEAWAKANVEWMKKLVNKPGQEDNLISAMLHMDENGAPHIHFIVLPFDEKGQLNASQYTKGSWKLKEMQTSYAKAMEVFGLRRGLGNSKATHQDIAKFYTELNHTLDKQLPPPEKDETLEEYHERANKMYMDVQMKRFQEQKKAERDIVEAHTFDSNQYLEIRRQMLELERIKKETELEIKERKKAAQKEIEQMKLDTESECNKLTRGLHHIYKSIYEESIISGNLDFKDMLEDMKAFNVLKKALEVYPDDKIRMRTVDRIKKIYKWYVEEEKARKMIVEDYLSENTDNNDNANTGDNYNSEATDGNKSTNKKKSNQKEQDVSL